MITLNSEDMTNSEKPAFSKAAFYHPDGGVDSPQTGLTKREYFAGLVMQSMVTFDLGHDFVYAKEIAKRSIIMADELLKQLEE